MSVLTRPVTIGLLLTVAALSRAEDKVVHEQQKIKTSKESITIEVFRPKDKAKHPAVLMLHGADGLSERLKAFQDSAKEIAGKGYVVFLPHYFEATSTKAAEEKEILEHFLTWMSAIRSCIAHAKSHANVEKDHVGLLGYSLGAYLSLSSAATASKQEHKVAAIAEYFGALPLPFRVGIKQLPPTLILHGDKDTVVSVEEAKTLAKLLKQAMIEHQMKIFAGQPHVFRGKAVGEAAKLVTAFFAKHLKNKKE